MRDANVSIMARACNEQTFTKITVLWSTMKMMLSKWCFLFLTISAIEGSLRLGKPEGFSVEERVMEKILETCYGDNDFKDLIFILGDVNEVFDKASVIRMDNLLNVDEEYESRQLLSIGVTKVLIIVNSPKTLHSDLISFRKTRWWNHMLPFFIIGKNDEKCGIFNEMLNITWRMGILNSIYICSESENTTLYTLNPITNYAPDPWKIMDHLNDSNIYRQIFDPNISCNNLNYDKTKVLNGYRIKSIHERLLSNDTDPSTWTDATHLWILTYHIKTSLNASISFSWDRDEAPDDRVDVIFHESTPEKTVRGSPLYFLIQFQCIALVESNDSFIRSMVLYKIRHLWSSQVLCISAISLVILYFILRIKNDEVTSAILDIIRFLTCVSMRTDMRNNSFRIYFTTMLIFIVITNGVFQGEIAAFLTKSDKVQPAKSIEELNDLGYYFYVHYSCARVLSGLHLSESNVKFCSTSSYREDICLDHALNATLSACILPSWLPQYLYLPKFSSLIRIYESSSPYSWSSRRDWPIHERFNSLLMRIFESGIYAIERNVLMRTMKAKDKANDHELALTEIQPSYRPIELANFKLAFKFLAMGLTFAISVLIVELRMREI